MPSKATAEAKTARKKIVLPVTINRRKEWRFDLPLTAVVQGKLPAGKPFQETAKLTNISSGGAYFHLDSAVVVGSKVKLSIEIPKELAEGNKVRLEVAGLTIRLQKPEKRGKKQGVAVRFARGFKFLPAGKKSA